MTSLRSGESRLFDEAEVVQKEFRKGIQVSVTNRKTVRGGFAGCIEQSYFTNFGDRSSFTFYTDSVQIEPIE